jgi:hypothetical protein
MKNLTTTQKVIGLIVIGAATIFIYNKVQENKAAPTSKAKSNFIGYGKQTQKKVATRLNGNIPIGGYICSQNWDEPVNGNYHCSGDLHPANN